MPTGGESAQAEPSHSASPMYPLRDFFRLARLTGLPFAQGVDAGGKVTIVLTSRRRAYLQLLAYAAAVSISWFTLFAVGFGTFGAFLRALEGQGFSTTESIASVVGFVPNLFTMGFYILIFHKMGDDLQDFCEKFVSCGVSVKTGTTSFPVTFVTGAVVCT